MAFSSSTAAARLPVTVPPEWDLATLMPDGAVGASAAGREAVALAQHFAETHRDRVAGYDAAALGGACDELEQVQEALTRAYAYAMLRFDADTAPPEHGALVAGGSRSPQQLGEIVGVDLSDPGFWATGLALIECNLGEAQSTSVAVPS